MNAPFQGASFLARRDCISFLSSFHCGSENILYQECSFWPVDLRGLLNSWAIGGFTAVIPTFFKFEQLSCLADRSVFFSLPPFRHDHIVNGSGRPNRRSLNRQTVLFNSSIQTVKIGSLVLEVCSTTIPAARHSTTQAAVERRETE